METVKKPSYLEVKGCYDNWKEWKESFETYLRANGLLNDPKVTDKIKITILKIVMGPEGQELLKNFTFENFNDKNNFEKVLKKLENYFIPKKNLTVERFNFNAVVQREGESFNNFLLELKTKAASCEFGELNDSLIRDRIVCGINDKIVQKRLLTEMNVSLEDAINICCAAESRGLEAKESINKTEEVNIKTEFKYEQDELDINMSRHIGQWLTVY